MKDHQKFVAEGIEVVALKRGHLAKKEAELIESSSYVSVPFCLDDFLNFLFLGYCVSLENKIQADGNSNSS